MTKIFRIIGDFSNSFVTVSTNNPAENNDSILDPNMFRDPEYLAGKKQIDVPLYGDHIVFRFWNAPQGHHDSLRDMRKRDPDSLEFYQTNFVFGADDVNGMRLILGPTQYRIAHLDGRVAHQQEYSPTDTRGHLPNIGALDLEF
jgi:hypothetical protein